MNKFLIVASLIVFTGCQTARERGPASAPALPGLDAKLIELPSKKIACTEIGRSPDGNHVRRDCTYATPNGKRTIHVMSLSGDNFLDNAYWHGRLLAKEIDEGSLNEALDNFNKIPSFVNIKDATKRKIVTDGIMSLYGCYERKMMKSVSPEFLDATKRIYAGYREGLGGTPRISEADFIRATLTIEMGNFFGGMMERFEGGLGEKVSTGVDVLLGCGGAAFQSLAQEPEVRGAIRGVAAGMERLKFACTGIVATAPWTSGGTLIHARNLEQTAMINTWNKHPTMFIMNEKNQPHKYVAFGTAGLAFPGGISGMNDRGISVSLHQMSTTAVESSWPAGTAAMMPFLQQRILREAGSIDEAIAIVKNTHAFSSWSILISDGIHQESASIEISSKRFSVARRRKDDVMGQSNMFLAKEMQPLNFQHRYNNVLESFARLQTTESEMRSTDHKMDLQSTVNILASHRDFYEPTGERAFGRSIARVSNILSSIVMPNPAGGGGKVWMTVADQLPPNQGYYAGFDVDFAAMTLMPIGAVKSGTYASRPNYERSFERYHQAYIAHFKADDATALRLLEEATRLAEKDGVDEPTYKYIRARFLLNAGKAMEAYPLFLELTAAKYEFHPLRSANIAMYLMYAGDQIGGGAALRARDREINYDASKMVVDDILSHQQKFHPTYPYLFGYVDGKNDLETKRKMWDAIYNRQPVQLQDVDMSTVD